MLIEWKRLKSPSKSQFEQCVAAVEFFHSRFQGRLKAAHAAIKGWSIEHQPNHKILAGSDLTAWLGAQMAARGRPRIGYGINLQQRLGLRPSELLGLLPEHITIVGGCRGQRRALFRLGARVGTKAKREQVVILLEREFPK